MSRFGGGPGGSLSCARRLAREPRSVGAAREFVARTLTVWGFGDGPDGLDVCVSEVVTNAVVHGGEEDGEDGEVIMVRVVVAGAGVRVEVWDADTGLPVGREAGPCEESGRGLALVGALAEEWGVVREAVGKTVWLAWGTTTRRVP
ncbi:ATP-binding protein [Streptomyces sp. 4N509B]|uniref:ATP-binding protein n=1 Tax=Streptomyces sp. 4N509B TaxID=3457413 RepID=UPI003FD2E08E